MMRALTPQPSTCCSCSSRGQQQVKALYRPQQHVQQHPQPLLPGQPQPPQPLLGAAVAAAALLISNPAYAATAAANFGTKCLGCHVGGGNIIQSGATLFKEDLVKNGFADDDSLYKLIYSGKGRMPGFGAECAPKIQCTFGAKLSDAEVQDLVQYVQDQAAAGWKPQQ